MNTQYRRHPDLRLTELENEGVVLHLGSRRYFTVSESGLVLLEALVRRCTIDQLTEHLLELYDVTRAEAEESVRTFLTRCTEADLVVSVDDPGR